MASLELIPKPDVLVVQGGIFLTGIFVIKKLMIDPYLKVKDARASLTTGSQHEAEAAIAKSEELTETIHTKIADASQQARQERDAVKEEALATRAAIVAAADEEAKQIISAVTNKIQEELAEEKAKIASTVDSISKELYTLALQ